MIKIKSLHIHMFRFYEDRNFRFVTATGEITPLVLITGGNGKGKTSVMDAIEWCITGDVEHLSKPYKIRVKNDQSKVQNSGLLRNKHCKKNEETWVEVIFDEAGVESILRRSTLNNEFGSDRAPLSIAQEGKKLEQETAEKWLVERFDCGDKPFADFFYKYFICDLQKAEDFRCKGRKDMTYEFEDFTLDHSESKQVLENLEQIYNQLDEKIRGLKDNKEPLDARIKQLEQEQQNLKETAQIIAYTQRISYPEERLDVDQLTPEQLNEQLEILIAGGYYTVIDKLNELILSRRRLMVKEQFEAHQLDIQNAIQKELYNSNTLLSLENQRKKTTEQLINLTDQNLEQAGEFVSEQKNTELTPAEWQLRWGEYCNTNNTWRKTESIFEDCKKGDELLTAFSRLVGVRTQIDEYRKEHRKCPLCGAEEPFVSEPAEQLAIEAENYVKAHDDKKLVLEKQLKEEKELWNVCKARLYNDLKDKLRIAEKKLGDEVDADKKILETTSLFFKQIETLNLAPEQFVDLTTLEIHSNFAGIDVDSIHKQEQEIKSLLSFLGYSDIEQIITAPETVRETIRPLTQKVPAAFKFEEQDIQDKITSLRLRKSNQHLMELSRELSDKREQSSKLIEQIQTNDTLQDLVKKRAFAIREILNQMKKSEVENVAPYLFHIFSKLVKHSSLEGFQFQGNNAKATDTKITFTDNNDNPILNLISDGQLGAFMLSYLLGNAFRRKDIGNFHCYFVDDITNSMDDINLISFVDLIKYQLAESRKGNEKNAAIQQFFFSTCDGNLKRMFQYKMEGFEIPVALIDLDIP